MSLLRGWEPPRTYLKGHLVGGHMWQEDPDERFVRHIQDVSYDNLKETIERLDARISELAGMMARHKITDQRKPESEERAYADGRGSIRTFTAAIKDRRGRKA